MPPKTKKNMLKTIFIPVISCGCGRGRGRSHRVCSNPSTKPKEPSPNSTKSSPLPSTPHSADKPSLQLPPPETQRTFPTYTSPLLRSSEPSPSTTLLLSPCLKLNESIAMAKESINPFEDFRYSMKQMIDERKIETEDELKELLRCFLDINPPVQHNVIVRAFVYICSDLRPPHDRRGKTLGKLLRLYISPLDDESHAGQSE